MSWMGKELAGDTKPTREPKLVLQPKRASFTVTADSTEMHALLPPETTNPGRAGVLEMLRVTREPLKVPP